MKVYISLPIAGHERTVRSRYEDAKAQLLNKFGKDTEIYGPTNILDFSSGGLDPEAPVHSWAWHLGEDIKDLLECDVIYLCQGWSWSKGCRTELAVAKANLIDVQKQAYADSRLETLEFSSNGSQNLEWK